MKRGGAYSGIAPALRGGAMAVAATLIVVLAGGCSGDDADAPSDSDASVAGRGDEGGDGADAGRGGSGASAGTGSAAGEGGGDAGAGAPDDRCASDEDCVLCILPLSTELPCCDGCPAVTSQARCEFERAAADDACQPGMQPICPAILCVAPGTPKCDRGMCISIEGSEQ